MDTAPPPFAGVLAGVAEPAPKSVGDLLGAMLFGVADPPAAEPAPPKPDRLTGAVDSWCRAVADELDNLRAKVAAFGDASAARDMAEVLLGLIEIDGRLSDLSRMVQDPDGPPF